MKRTPGPCVRNLPHRFGASSGWCLNHGCGWRDDGQSAYNPRPEPEPIVVRDITEPLHSRGDVIR